MLGMLRIDLSRTAVLAAVAALLVPNAAAARQRPDAVRAALDRVVAAGAPGAVALAGDRTFAAGVADISSRRGVSAPLAHTTTARAFWKRSRFARSKKATPVARPRVSVSMRATSTVARASMAVRASGGTRPRRACARLTASSTRSMCSKRASSDQIAPISGSVAVFSRGSELAG